MHCLLADSCGASCGAAALPHKHVSHASADDELKQRGHLLVAREIVVICRDHVNCFLATPRTAVGYDGKQCCAKTPSHLAKYDAEPMDHCACYNTKKLRDFLVKGAQLRENALTTSKNFFHEAIFQHFIAHTKQGCPVILLKIYVPSDII